MKPRFSSMPLAGLTAITLLSLPLVSDALTETNLYTFGSSLSDGNYSRAVLVQGSDGNFYGTAFQGGANSLGTVFRISPNGSYTNLHLFAGGPNDGASPGAGLVKGSDGNFYGTTQSGGASFSAGTVFRINSSGSLTILHSFQGGVSSNGYLPNGVLVQGSDGNFYGTTAGGGANGLGTVFRMSPSGSYTNLHSFAGYPNDGKQPEAGLVQGSDGNFYGTTYYDGTNICQCGTVFRISPSGSYTILHSFAGHPDGANPYAGDALVRGSDGNLYGTTSQGGTGAGGVVFRISPGGSYTNLHSFAGFPNEGSQPQAGLVQGSDGNFYGTTFAGGTKNVGAVFRMSPSGSYTTLYSFGGYPNDGNQPEAGLVQGSDGSFYGTTFAGGTNNVGTVFKLFAILASPANQINGTSLDGTNVVITIASVAGETYQLQYTTNLTSGNWSSVPGVSVTNSIGGPLTVTNLGGALSPSRYYRFAITP